MVHNDRVDAVLAIAIRDAIKGHEIASGTLIRERVESCLATALAICKEDRTNMYEWIDALRSTKR